MNQPTRIGHALLVGLLGVVACREKPDERSLPNTHSQPAAAQSVASALRVLPVASVAPAPSERAPLEPSAGGVPYDVRPAVQVKYINNGTTERHAIAEPGVLVGAQKKLLKAFDCVSPGAPHADVLGVCVGFKECSAAPPSAAPPSDPSVFAEIVCTGPAARLQLVREGSGLVFKLGDERSPLAKRRLSRIELPEATTPTLGAFEHRNLTVNVDL